MPILTTRRAAIAPPAAAPAAPTVADPLAKPVTRRQRRAAARDLRREEADRKYDRMNLCYNAQHIGPDLLGRDGQPALVLVEEADDRIGRAMRLVDAHQNVRGGRARRLRMLTSALTDAPAWAAQTASWDAAVARLSTPDLAEHPEARAARAALAVADLQGAKSTWQDSELGRIRGREIDAAVSANRDAVLPPDLARIVFDYAIDGRDQATAIAGKHATPLADRPGWARFAGAVVAGGALSGGLGAAVAGGIFMAGMLGPAGAVLGIMGGAASGQMAGVVGGGSTYGVWAVFARLAHGARGTLRRAVQDHRWADSGNIRH